MPPKIEAIDLFCGAGGLTRGLLNVGIHVHAGVDCDKACEYPYTHNNKAKFICKKIEGVSAEELSTYFTKGKVTLLAGCAPCQPFSKYSQGRDASKDGKWGLLHHFADLVGDLSPDLVTMENVPELVRHTVFHDFVEELSRQGYHLDFKVVDCRLYGLPQSRQRLVLLASKFGKVTVPNATHATDQFVSVREAIGSLTKLEAGEQDQNDPLHLCSRLSPLNLKRIRQSKPGGTWRDWSPELIADCHKSDKGKTYGSVYGRMSWDAPAPTMTTQCFGFGNGRFGHPEQDRAISLREAAIFQSFPPNYRFTKPDDPVYIKVIGRLIGNAVPVKLGEVIGLSLIEHVKNHTTENR